MASLFVISGPSGSGKTTLARKVVEELEGLEFSVSYTTRPSRPGEVDGRDYFFVSRSRFLELVDSGEVIEWAEVYGELYGTSRSFIEKRLSAGIDVVLDIDTEGALSLMKAGFSPITIFVLPPSFRELQRRVKGRGTEPDEVLKRRMESSFTEIVNSRFYRYIVLNDDIDKATEEIKAIVVSCRAFYTERKRMVEEVLSSWQG